MQEISNSNYSESVQNTKIKLFEKINEEKSKGLFKQLSELNNKAEIFAVFAIQSVSPSTKAWACFNNN